MLVLPATPPLGFNTFDNYESPLGLNSTSVPEILRLLAASPLFGAGYRDVYGFSGWAQSYDASNGTFYWNLDEWGRPVPAPDRFPPGSMQAAAAVARSLGLRFGLWHIRGINAGAAARKLPVKGMEQYTLDQLVDTQATGGGANGSCLWASDWLGVNASHPAAQTYYEGVIDALVSLGCEVIEADCFMCEPCYTDEMLLVSNAIKARPENLTLYFSPGGGNQPYHGAWVASTQLATFYRTNTDFHGGWYDWAGLQQSVFIAGNFTAANLHGANGTWPDLDQMPMDGDWWAQGDDPVEQRDRGQTIITVWAMGRYPLMSAGALPLDDLTVSYLTNPTALALNQRSEPPGSTLVSYEGNCTCTGGPGSCTIPHGPNDHPLRPCVAKWVALFNPGLNFTTLMMTNIGEDNATSTTGFAELGLPALPALRYRVSDIWTGDEIGVFTGNQSFTSQLRKHASLLLRIASV